MASFKSPKFYFSKNCINFAIPVSPLVDFINLGYYLLYVPFYVKWNPSANQFSVYYCKIQRCISFLIYIFLFYFYTFIISEKYNHFLNNDGSLVRACFDLMTTLGSCSLSIMVFKLMWLDNKSSMECFLNSTTTKKSTLFSNLGYKICLISGCLLVGYFYCSGLITALSRPNSSEFPDHVYYIKFSRFLYSKPLTKIIWLLLQTHFRLFYYVSHSFFCALSWSLLKMAKDFSSHLYECPTLSADAVIECVFVLQTKLDVINMVVSSKLLAFFIAVLGYVCEIPDYFHKSYIHEDTAIVALFFVMDTCAFVFTAEFHYLVRQSRLNWYKALCRQRSTNIHSVDKLDVLEIQSSLAMDNTALSCRWFDVTYKLLASVRLRVNMKHPYYNDIQNICVVLFLDDWCRYHVHHNIFSNAHLTLDNNLSGIVRKLVQSLHL